MNTAESGSPSPGKKRLKEHAKRLIFGLLGKDPEAVVVSFLAGQPEVAAAMLTEVMRLIPDRRHYAVGLRPFAAPERVMPIVLKPAGTWGLYWQLRRSLHRYRIGMAPVLFTGEPEYRNLRWAAWLLAPTRILAFNGRLERHHLRLRQAIASWLFLRGVPLDRIFLRPRWLFPFRRDRSVYPDCWRVVEGRPVLAGRPHVAVITPYFPWPLAHGGAVRIFHLLREAAHQFNLYLFSFTEGGQQDCGPVLEFCSRVVLVEKPRYREPRWASIRPPEVCEYRSPGMRRALRELAPRWGIQLVQVEYTLLAEYAGDVLVAHDVTSDLYQQLYRRQPTLSRWWDLWRWRKFELRAARRFRRVVVMCEEDSAKLPGARTVVIPNGVDLEHFRPEPERAGQRVLFVGSFRHFPNAAAFRWLAEEIWPAVRARLPEATLTVVAGPEPELYWREHTGQARLPVPDGVTLLAFVGDVRPLYAEANLVVVPTQVSAGTNLKVLEAMAMARAVVSTSRGCAGLGLEHGVSVWIADETAAFVEGVVGLLQDSVLRRRLAEAARQRAEARFDWRRLGVEQGTLWKELLRAPIRIRPAEQGDLPAIAQIEVASPEAAMWAPDELLRHQCLVAELCGRVVGFIVWRHLGQGEGEILNLAVWPELRGQGIGTRLLESVTGVPGITWYLEVRQSNQSARRLYEKLGFYEVSRRKAYYSDTGEDAVVMRKDSC